MNRSKKSKPETSPGIQSQKLLLRQPLDLIVRYSARMLHNKGQVQEGAAAEDLAKIRSLGEQLAEFLDNLRELNSSTMHDLRTTLNGIIGYCEMLQEDAGGSAFADLQKVLSAAREFQHTLEALAAGSIAGEKEGGHGGEVVERDAMIKATMQDIEYGSSIHSETSAQCSGSILVVDDNEINRDLLASQLRRQGHRVALASNGRQALEVIAEENIDMMLLDIMMPEMNGYEVLEHLRSNPGMQSIPIIVISALDMIASVVRCIQLGAQDYLLKPFNPVLLNARINSCLEMKRLRERGEALALGEFSEEEQFIAESREMQNILHTVKTVSRNPVNVLLHGSSGTGKEVLARMIHADSKRKDKPFVAVNCAAIPENLVESEFFGYEKGAFTGASSSRGGYFEEAAGGTLFLDEIGDMPLFLQPKLLRAIQEEEGRRLGGSTPVPYDVRIISATNKDLLAEVKSKRFRKDLFYRIFSVEIKLPPLRDRREDIVPLAFFFLKKVNRRFDKKVAGFAPDVLRFFEEYAWPGNVRQLLHEIERLVALTPEGEEILLKDCSQELLDARSRPWPHRGDELAGATLSERVKKLEIACIHEALSRTGGKKLPAAKLLGITRVGLDNKIKRYGIDPAAHGKNS
jgi:DNA-binding NtrC family response regulator